MNQNCLSYWYPRLRASGVSVPRTLIVHAPCLLHGLIDGGDCPAGALDLFDQIKSAATQIGFPCFLRTGHTSGKHGWDSTCYLTDPDAIPDHVANLVEYSEEAHPLGLDSGVWCVREILPVVHAFRAFAGMPIAREFRAFVENGQPTHLQPYWPPDSIERPLAADWRDRLATISKLTASESENLAVLATRAVKFLPGDWSIDLLQTNRGWYVTDMALAADSFRYAPKPFIVTEPA